MNIILPVEIKDKIFLYLGWEDLEKCRELQSPYIKKLTQYDNLYEAAEARNLDNINWLIENGCDLGEFHFRGANQLGNLNIMKYVFKKCDYWEYPWNWRAFTDAAKFGNLNIMKWLLKNGCFWHYETYKYAAESGILDNLKWLLENDCTWDEHTFASSTRFGYYDNKPQDNNLQDIRLQNMKWLLKNSFPWDENTISDAIKFNNLNNIKWILDNGCPYGDVLFYETVRNERLDVMKYFLEINLPLDEFTFNGGAISGNLVNMKWLLKNGCPWNDEACSYTTEFCTLISDDDDGLNNMKWLYMMGCLWKESVFYTETDWYDYHSAGVLQIMKMCLKNGCPWNERATDYSIDDDITEWLLENGCPTSENFDTRYESSEESDLEL